MEGQLHMNRREGVNPNLRSITAHLPQAALFLASTVGQRPDLGYKYLGSDLTGLWSCERTSL